MSETIITVVITVYNKEAYLEDCILSVINQTFKNIEILIVNDGSTDNSSAIIEKYKNIDKRIKNFNTSNQGSSNARNVGIDNLKGDYVVFVDADDYCLPSMLESMYSSIVYNDADVCVCNVMRINANTVSNQSHKEDYCIDLENYGREQYIQNYIFKCKHAYCVWNRMYKSKIILENNIRFRDIKKIYPEDLLFNLEILLDSKKIMWVEKTLYIHILRADGITNGYRPNIVYRYINACALFRDTLKQRNIYEYMENVFYYIVQIETLCALKSLLRNNRATFSYLYSSVTTLYRWDFISDAFNSEFKGNFVQKLVRWSIKKKYVFFTSIIIYIFYWFKIEFI